MEVLAIDTQISEIVESVAPIQCEITQLYTKSFDFKDTAYLLKVGQDVVALDLNTLTQTRMTIDSRQQLTS